MHLKRGESIEWDNVRRKLRGFLGKTRQGHFKGQNDLTNHASYKRFKRRIIPGRRSHGPAASTPLTTRWRYEPSCEFDTVRQRLELDSPPRHHEEMVIAGGLCLGENVAAPKSSSTTITRGCLSKVNATEQVSVWRSAVVGHSDAHAAGSDVRRHDLKPFTILDKTSLDLRGKSLTSLVAPTLVNDYYTNLLDCSCNGMIALALGSSVYLWNSETRALMGYLETNPQPGRGSEHHTRSISCLCWSGEGTVLCIGTRQGEIQLWDVECKHILRRLPSHMSVVRALSWKQHLVSSGSVLGRIHHIDSRAPAPVIGSAVQKVGLCSLQWSPGGDWLASGSTGGLLSVWGSDITGCTGSHHPLTTMKQPSAVKAMGWCPWQRSVLATGGGWKDGELRIWDTISSSCVTHTTTNSQICSLRWAEKKRCLVTGHGLPQHHVSCWSWDLPSLSLTCQLTGHSQRVLHVALNPGNTQIFSAGADQCLCIWDM